MFEFDRPSARAERARTALPWFALVAAATFMLLDALLTRVLGGFWGLLLAIALVAAPVAALYRVSLGVTTLRRAVAEGLGVGILAPAIYAWIFGGPLGFAP